MTQQIRTVLESLTLGTGTIVVAVLSAALVWFLCSICRVAFPKFWVVLVPFTIANCLYWSPVWLGADASEYHTWTLVVIPPWFLAGVVVSAVVVWVLGKNRAS